ncbi:protein of unknown function [Agrobacterium pusense]|uniref:Uncharacterized protein n=1 Tax=Agrobacterium pusense TaxID=648995 RepID=U4PT21_9HYPH|nr:protein of unknown function [Agrobacterium pusense]
MPSPCAKCSTTRSETGAVEPNSAERPPVAVVRIWREGAPMRARYVFSDFGYLSYPALFARFASSQTQ